jgi:DNA-binding beta-propeller fold protein YncE
MLAPAAAGAANPVGKLEQLRGAGGCVVDKSRKPGGCTSVRALKGPGPFLGSEALAISPDGHNVYVAAAKSDAITVLTRNRGSGKLSQPDGEAGCISSKVASCADAVGLDRPNSVVVSPDGDHVYATALGSDAVTVFERDPSTGALSQAGCIAAAAARGCAAGRALDGPDVVRVSPDGRNVYVGAFFGNAVAAFARDRGSGELTQLAGSDGCIAATAAEGCATGTALHAPEGLALSHDGTSVYAATAVSNAVVVLGRDPSTGALSQAADGSGCIANAGIPGCTTGVQLEGANAVVVSYDDEDVYVTSLLSNSLTSFTRDPATGRLTQQPGTSACVVYVLAVGCSLGRAFDAPEGVSVSPDGESVYAAAFGSGAVDTFNRDPDDGWVIQKGGRAGCVTVSRIPDCARGRKLKKAGAVIVSPNGENVYAAAFGSNAIAAFKRVTK